MRLELSPAQVQSVLRGSDEDGTLPALVARLGAVREALARDPGLIDDPRFSQSLLAGLLILASIPGDGSWVANAELARRLGMNSSTAHRYVTTLVAAGLIEREPSTRLYRLA